LSDEKPVKCCPSGSFRFAVRGSRFPEPTAFPAPAPFSVFSFPFSVFSPPVLPPLAPILQKQLEDAPHRRLPFAQVMELMLYHPEHGYYGPAPRKLGRGGDFFTSVSVGPLYGRLLAQLARQQW